MSPDDSPCPAVVLSAPRIDAPVLETLVFPPLVAHDLRIHGEHLIDPDPRADKCDQEMS